ncbi:response regulator transcription factor [Paenibacillus soyae]|uniref:Response regulator transcription factor n=1 Tax=Paenibacillus soyae TaxID=2969249 RepID=A0A9X2N2B4_9BACL|nr:response regulator transcription factor [Paenibacillus soyae]MCR2807762.1 response regulator transcription factor [Paenibacillus soyae]
MTTGGICKIMIVDDEVLIRQGIKHFMNWEQEGFQIVGEASNGQEALEQIERLRPHIVLTDIVMPVMDGEELTRRIKSQYPEIEVIVLSSFGEFQYVRSTFQSGVADYILKPKLDLQHLLTVLKLTAERIPSLRGGGAATAAAQLSGDQLIERLLSGYELPCDEEDTKAVFPYPAFRIVGAAASGGELGAKLEELLRREVPEAMLHAVRGESRVVAYLVNAERAQLDMLPFWAQSAAAKLRDGSGSGRPLLLSETFHSLAELHDVYRLAFLKLADYAFYLPDRSVIAGNNLPEPGPVPESFQLSRFTEELKRGRFQAAFEYLRAYSEELAACYTADVFEFKSFLGNVVFNVTVLLGNMQYDVKELEKNKYRYFKAIEDSGTARDAIGRLEEFIAEAEASIAEKMSHAGAGNANMKRLLDYIHEHYAEPLSLTEMAKHFHFNPSYLSSYFSSHNEEGFVDYLHKVRTEKAEELLRKGEAMISEISGMVGYSDHSYFCKVFKKHTGLSPSRYRRQYMNDESRG